MVSLKFAARPNKVFQMHCRLTHISVPNTTTTNNNNNKDKGYF